MSVADLETALAAVDEAIANFDHTRITYSVDGRSFSPHVDYESLLKRRKELRQQIINEGGAVRITTNVIA